MKEKIKLYDKELIKTGETIRTVLILLVVFMIGFAAGYVAINKELQGKIVDQELIINNQYIELDSLRESIHMYQLYGK